MADQEMVVQFTPPDEWLGRHWSEYIKGRSLYAKAHPDGAALNADCAGALALLKAGYIKLAEAPDNFKKLLGLEIEDMPLWVIMVLVNGVARKIEDAVNGPLALKVI